MAGHQYSVAHRHSVVYQHMVENLNFVVSVAKHRNVTVCHQFVVPQHIYVHRYVWVVHAECVNPMVVTTP